MQQEFENIRGVLEWIVTTGNCIEIGQQIVIRIGILWITTSYFIEGGKWCALILSLSGESMPVAIRAALLVIAGLIAWAQGNYSSAQENMDESLELLGTLEFKTLEDKDLLAQALIVRGLLASTTRDLGTANAMLQRSIELFEETHNQWFEAIALSWLGDIALYANDRDRAKELHDQSIKLAREQGDPWCLVPALMTSSQVAVLDKDLISARSILLEAVELLHETGDQWSFAFALNDLGHVALMEGELDQAGSYFLEGLTLAQTLGNQRVLVVSLVGAAALIATKSMVPNAAKRQDASDLTLAARLCGASAVIAEKPGIFIWVDSKMLYEAAISQVRLLLDAELWEKSYSEGKSMPFDEAIAITVESLKKIVTPQSPSVLNKEA